MTGNELKRIRQALGLTQKALAERVGVATNTVARWERDELPIRAPVARLVRLIAQTDSAKTRPGRGKRR